jgi:23S rRNA (adenine2503-C2)-methyltransferase
MSSKAVQTTCPQSTGPEILGVTSDVFVEHSGALGVPRIDAIAAYRAFYREGRREGAWFALEDMPMGTQEIEGETIKFTLRLGSGEEIRHETESVLIPMQGRGGRKTRTLCVSSQIGCAMGCDFCETAQMGLIRNLSSAQIVAQWFAARHVVGEEVNNIVFMGMGEPMDNIEEVIGAIRVNLAISVNAPDDEVRNQLMPINRAMNLEALQDALLEFPLRGGSALLIEYVLIPEVNDSLEQCDRLCRWLEPLRCSLNVIPYNPRRDSPWSAPTETSVDAFVRRATENGQFTKRRGTKGRDVMAACGQLGNPEIRRQQRPGRETAS